MSLSGVAIGFLIDFLVTSNRPDDHKIFHYLTSVAITILVWEGNLIIDRYMNKKFPWIKNPVKRIAVHLPLSLIFSSIAIFTSMLFFDSMVCKIPHSTRLALMTYSVVIGLLITLIILSMEIGAQFYRQWRESLVEVEKYRAQSVQAQLQNLKDQVNPHFLFNNMSVLSSLVYKDQDKAVDFISQLSKVYRYILDTRSSELVSLEEEMRFMESYCYLLKIRFDESLQFIFNIGADKKDLMLLPMAMQMLVENAIKHNEVSEEQPLLIEITCAGHTLEVSNNLQLRSHREHSSGTGLENIRIRYKFYTDKPVEVLNDGKKFNVKIPLLQRT